VVLGVPNTPEPEVLGELRERHAGREALARSLTPRDRSEVENRQLNGVTRDRMTLPTALRQALHRSGLRTPEAVTPPAPAVTIDERKMSLVQRRGADVRKTQAGEEDLAPAFCCGLRAALRCPQPSSDRESLTSRGACRRPATAAPALRGCPVLR
jgi:hypothetical protein